MSKSTTLAILVATALLGSLPQTAWPAYALCMGSDRSNALNKKTFHPRNDCVQGLGCRFRHPKAACMTMRGSSRA